MIDMIRIVEIIESEKLYPEIQYKIMVNSEKLIIELSGLVNGKEYRVSRIFGWAELCAMHVPYLYIQDAVSSLMGNLVEASRL